jgi:hypothetical protein
MIKRLLMMALLFASGSAWADYDALLKTAMFNNSYQALADPVAACRKSGEWPAPANASYTDFVFTLIGPANMASSYQCQIIWKGAAPQTVTADIKFHCPYGGTPNQSNLKNVCIGGNPPPPPCSEMTPFSMTQKFGKVIPPGGFPMPTAFEGCKIFVDAVEKCFANIETNILSCRYTVRKTGEVATTTDSPGVGPATEPGAKDVPAQMPKLEGPQQGSCPKGSVQGGFDSRGIQICIGTGTAPSNPPKTALPKIEKPPSTVTNEDGSTTTTKETVTTNSDGSTTTTKEVVTTAPDGTVTRGGGSETGTNASGGAGQSDEAKDAEKNDLCKTNPTLSVCRNSSVSGSCGEITCEGDAIQCATLRAAAKMECRMQKDAEDLAALPLNALGAAGVSGNDPLKSTFPTIAGATIVQVPSQLDASGWLGNGACFADKTISIQGQTIVIPLSAGCDALLVLRYALMVVAGLVSFRILSGAILT